MATELALDSFFIMVAAVLVLFMQAGFAMLEVGFSRMKNAGAVMAKIFINLSVAAIVFWAVGWTLIYGGDNLGGWLGGFSQAFYDMDFVGGGGDYSTFIETEEYNLIPGVDWFFQFAFAAVSLAIVWGTMLDRTKFIGYVIFGAVFIALIYPTVAHWTWGGGWLAEEGFLDFAGSSIVHLCGATAALAGTLVLGPRIGKFRNGKAVPIPGHSMPLALLGILILWVGWMGFNGGSTLGAIEADFGLVLANTNLAAAAGVIGATIASLLVFRTLDVSQMGNGAIAGLVGITAPCAFIQPPWAVVVGLVAGLLVPPVVILLDKVLVDDPLGAIPAHGIAGIWGTLAIGLFGDPALMDTGRGSLFDGAEGGQLWVQFYGVIATFVLVFIAAYVVFTAIKLTVGLRVTEEQEMLGLDISEHGMFGYPERFIEVTGAESTSSDGSAPAPAASE